MSVKLIEHIIGAAGEDLGSIHRYTQTELKTGRWSNRGTVERAYWRAIPSNAKVPITYHSRRKDAVDAVRQSHGLGTVK